MSYLPNYMNLAIKLPSSYNLANMTFMIQVSLIKNTLVLWNSWSATGFFEVGVFTQLLIIYKRKRPFQSDN